MYFQKATDWCKIWSCGVSSLFFFKTEDKDIAKLLEMLFSFKFIKHRDLEEIYICKRMVQPTTELILSHLKWNEDLEIFRLWIFHYDLLRFILNEKNTDPQSGAGHHLVSASTAKTRLTIKSSYLSIMAGSSRMILISKKKMKKNEACLNWCKFLLRYKKLTPSEDLKKNSNCSK